MANQRILLSFLEAQAQVRAERVRTHRAMRNPNGQMVSRFADEEKMLRQIKDIVAAADFSRVTETSEESYRKEVAEQLEEDREGVVVASAHKVTANGKRIGRPPKMTKAQIEAIRDSPIGTAMNDKD